MNSFIDSGINHLKQYKTTKNPIVGPLGGQHDQPGGINKAAPSGVSNKPQPPGGVRDEALARWSTFARRFGNMLPHNLQRANKLYDVNKMLANADHIKSSLDFEQYRRPNTVEHLFR